MELRQQCGTRRRRQLVRGSDAQVGGLRVNGIDYVEVLDDTAPTEALRQRLLDVTFVRPDGALSGGAPALGPEHFRVAGGSRVRGIVVESVEAGPGDRTLRLTVDRAGDHSVYALSLHAGVGAEEPPANMDRVLASVDVSFKVDCPTGFDCQEPPSATGVADPEPAIDYLAKDYSSFRQLMLDRMAETLPDWDERGPADLGVTLVEALAYAADQASYHQDAIGTEAHLTLARLRTSVLRHARLLGYRAAEGANARTVVAIEAAVDRAGSDPALVPAGTRFLTRAPAGAHRPPTALRPFPEVMDAAVNDGAVVFESMEPLTDLRVARNEMRLHTWGDDDCRLPVGATAAHLRGTLAGLALGPGDLVLLEELFPVGGAAVDPPDPAHRQVVRLTEPPEQMRDLVFEVDVVQVRWGEEDALRFALNLGSDAGEPGGVARGNLVLADQGRTVDHGSPRPEDEDVAGGSGLVDDRAPGARLRPRLDADRVVHAVPFEPRSARALSAVSALEPLAEPVAQVSLTGDGEEWVARPDLLATNRFTPEFKVEPLDDGGARVLFPDAREGRAPDPDAVATDFRARVRSGGGPVGNVGADAIRHVVSAGCRALRLRAQPRPGGRGSRGRDGGVRQDRGAAGVPGAEAGGHAGRLRDSGRELSDRAAGRGRLALDRQLVHGLPGGRPRGRAPRHGRV